MSPPHVEGVDLGSTVQRLAALRAGVVERRDHELDQQAGAERTERSVHHDAEAVARVPSQAALLAARWAAIDLDRELPDAEFRCGVHRRSAR